MKQLFFLFAMLLSIVSFGQETKIHTSQINPSGATDNQVLTYNAATGVWRAETAAAGGLQSVETDGSIDGDGTTGNPLSVNTTDLDNTFATDAELAASDAADGDKDATNEFQDIELTGTNVSLSDSGVSLDFDNTFSTDTERATAINSITYYDKFVEETFGPLSTGTAVTLTGTPPTQNNFAAWQIVRGLVQRVGDGVTVSNSNKTFTFTRGFEDGEYVTIRYPIQ